jgi:hypothetical protein
LQEVYGQLVALYQSVVANFASATPASATPEVAHHPEQVLFFVLECISNLIAGRGSVLSLWALDPAIFVVLTKHSRLGCARLAARQPWLHLALLTTLRTHCSSNGQFLASSHLISTSGSAVSPTSEYFRLLLEEVTAVMKQVTDTP